MEPPPGVGDKILYGDVDQIPPLEDCSSEPVKPAYHSFLIIEDFERPPEKSVADIKEGLREKNVPAEVNAVATDKLNIIPNRTKAFIDSLKWDLYGNSYENISYNLKELQDLFDEYNTSFDLSISNKTNFGTIKKKVVPPDTKIIVRADLHGNLRILVEELKQAKLLGHLDENYRCKENVEFVLLGDYMDRGNNILYLIKLLMLFKLENPLKVHLLRGNHESIHIIPDIRNDPNFKIFRALPENETRIEKFWETLHLSVLIGNGTGFVDFTHGLFELYPDFSNLIDAPANEKEDSVPIAFEMNDRVKALAVEIKEGQFQIQVNALKEQILAATKKSPERKALKYKLSATIICEFQRRYALRKEKEATNFNWAVIASGESKMGYPGRKEWALNPVDIKHALRLMTVDKDVRRVMMVVRGHDHQTRIDGINRKALVLTLPNDPPPKSGGYDRFYIITVGKSKEDWTRQAVVTKVASRSTFVPNVLKPVPLLSPVVEQPLNYEWSHDHS